MVVARNGARVGADVFPRRGRETRVLVNFRLHLMHVTERRFGQSVRPILLLRDAGVEGVATFLVISVPAAADTLLLTPLRLGRFTPLAGYWLLRILLNVQLLDPRTHAGTWTS
jgi:hypothetical protein